MRSSPVHIGKLLDWKRVIKLLDYPPTSGALPYYGRCPICQDNSFYIYNDTVNSAEWYHCISCKSSGDLISLAKTLWNQDFSTTINKLIFELPELKLYTIGQIEIQRYVTEIQNELAKVNSFWETASKRLITGLGLRHLRLDMGIAHDLTESEWFKRGGRFVGSAEQQEINDLAYKDNAHSLFKGLSEEDRKWKSMLVIPFWDAPEHLTAFSIYTADGSKTKLYKYLSMYGFLRAKPGVMPNQGIAMIDALNTNSDVVFVFLDTLLAARTHVKHLATNDNTLPIVAIWPASPAGTIIREQSAAKDLVFFNEKLSSDLIKHASAVNGRVVTHSHDHESLVIRHMRRMPIEKWLDNIHRASKPWDEVLEAFVWESSVQEIERLIYGMNWPLAKLRKFIDGCARTVRSKLDNIFTGNFEDRQIQVEGQVILETRDGWIKASNNDLISNGIFRIERVISYNKTDELFYQGQILFNEERIPFIAPKAKFDANPFHWIDNYLLKLNKGSLDYSTTWTRHGVTIAKRFYQPESIQGIDNYGWNESAGKFYLPNYCIELGGEIVRHGLPCPDMEATPALTLAEPTSLDETEIKYLSTSGLEQQSLWALASCVIFNLLASVYSHQTKGILVVGNSGPFMDDIGAALGCPKLKLNPNTRQQSELVLQEFESNASWPIIFEGKPNKSFRTFKWLESQPHNCIVNVDWWVSRALMIRGGWLKFESDIAFKPKPELLKVARKIVPLYLQDLAKRRLRREEGKNDLDEWFARMGGNSQVIEDGWNLVYEDYKGSAADTFFELLMQMYESGTLIFREDGTRPKSHGKTIIVGRENKVWLPKTWLNEALGNKSIYIPILDIGSVSQALTESGELLDEVSFEGVPCWRLSRETWDRRLNELNTLRRNKKKEIA